MKVEIYTDGGSRGNPGEGAYAALAVYPRDTEGNIHSRWIDGGYVKETTNNIMELRAIKSALYWTIDAIEVDGNPITEVEIVSDSQYSISAISEWAYLWKTKGWKTSSGPVKNLELVKLCHNVYDKYKEKITFRHVRGHSGDHYNEIVDGMCNAIMDNKKFNRDDKS